MLILNTRLVEYKPPPTDHTCPVDVARSRLLPPTGLFFSHCHATVFQVPTSSLDRLRMRTTIPFLSCRQNSGWRVWEKEKDSRDSEAETLVCPQPRRGSCVSGTGCGVWAGYGEWKHGGCWGTAPRLLVTFSSLCAAACLLTDVSLKGEARG